MDVIGRINRKEDKTFSFAIARPETETRSKRHLTVDFSCFFALYPNFELFLYRQWCQSIGVEVESELVQIFKSDNKRYMGEVLGSILEGFDQAETRERVFRIFKHSFGKPLLSPIGKKILKICVQNNLACIFHSHIPQPFLEYFFRDLRKSHTLFRFTPLTNDLRLKKKGDTLIFDRQTEVHSGVMHRVLEGSLVTILDPKDGDEFLQLM